MDFERLLLVALLWDANAVVLLGIGHRLGLGDRPRLQPVGTLAPIDGGDCVAQGVHAVLVLLDGLVGRQLAFWVVVVQTGLANRVAAGAEALEATGYLVGHPGEQRLGRCPGESDRIEKDGM
jgi:hypothetical protein